MTTPIFDPTSDRQISDPYPTYARMRAACPVFHHSEADVWVVTRHDDVMRVARDPQTYSSANAVKVSVGPEADEVSEVLAGGWSLTPNLTESDGEQHSRLRLAVNRVFTHRRVTDLEPFIRATAEELIGGFADAGSTDIIESYAWPLPLAVMASILGVPPEDLPQLRQWSHDWLELSVGAAPVAARVKCAHSVVAMQHYVMEMLEDGSRAIDGGLIASLATTSDESRLDKVELMRIVMNLIIAGHVTVTRAIGNGVVTLLENPRQLTALLDGEQTAEAMVEEVLRFESPVQGLFRTVTTETELGGQQLRAGDRLMIHWGSANRDEHVIDAPDRFVIESRPGRHMLAFGRGIHACIGASLARLELRIAIPLLFERLPGLHVGPVGSRHRERLMIARGYDELNVQWDVSTLQEVSP